MTWERSDGAQKQPRKVVVNMKLSAEMIEAERMIRENKRNREKLRSIKRKRKIK